LRDETLKNSGLAQFGPLLRHGYLPLVVPLPKRLTYGQIMQYTLRGKSNQLGVV